MDRTRAIFKLAIFTWTSLELKLINLGGYDLNHVAHKAGGIMGPMPSNMRAFVVNTESSVILYTTFRLSTLN